MLADKRSEASSINRSQTVAALHSRRGADRRDAAVHLLMNSVSERLSHSV